MKKLLLWIMETRPQFLTLSIVLAFLGTAIAWYDGPVNLGYALLAGFGLMLTHGSVNAINDYFDYKSGIDLDTERTPLQRRQRACARRKNSVKPCAPGGRRHLAGCPADRHLFYSRKGMAAAAAFDCSRPVLGTVYAGDTENALARMVTGSGIGHPAHPGFLFYPGRQIRLDGSGCLDSQRPPGAQPAPAQRVSGCGGRQKRRQENNSRCIRPGCCRKIFHAGNGCGLCLDYRVCSGNHFNRQGCHAGLLPDCIVDASLGGKSHTGIQTTS